MTEQQRLFLVQARSGHNAFVRFLRDLAPNRLVWKQFGFEGHHERWRNLIGELIPLADEVESLAPKLAGNGPNPEYPWPPSLTLIGPAEHDFNLWFRLQKTADGRRFLAFVAQLFQRADACI